MTRPPATFDLSRLAAHVGHEVRSDWLEVTQETVSGFADLTSDEQWIHVDPERARKESPYGTTIAHGFLTLSLISRLLRDAVRFDRAPRLAINYGLNRVRFPAALPTGAKIRGRFTLRGVEPAGGGLQATWSAVVEMQGSDKPCCAAEWLVRYHP